MSNFVQRVLFFLLLYKNKILALVAIGQKISDAENPLEIDNIVGTKTTAS